MLVCWLRGISDKETKAGGGGGELPQSGITKGWRGFTNLHLPHGPGEKREEQRAIQRLGTALNDRWGYHGFTTPVLQIWRSSAAARGLGIAA